MSEIFCIYKSKRYIAEIKNKIIEISSDYKDEGFTEYTDVLGRVHNDIFIKKLEIYEVDIIYKEDMFILEDVLDKCFFEFL